MYIYASVYVYAKRSPLNPTAHPATCAARRRRQQTGYEPPANRLLLHSPSAQKQGTSSSAVEPI